MVCSGFWKDRGPSRDGKELVDVDEQELIDKDEQRACFLLVTHAAERQLKNEQIAEIYSACVRRICE